MKSFLMSQMDADEEVLNGRVILFGVERRAKRN